MTRLATRLSVVAHASTAALRKAAFPADEPLDSFGERDCARITLDWRPARVFIAPELRARQTAAALGLAGEIVPALRDCDYGRWAGRSVKEIDEADPEGFGRWLAEPDTAPHGGESHRAVLERIAAWFGGFGIQPSHSVLVAHPITVRAAILHVLGAGAGAFQSVDAWPLSAADFTGATYGRRWHFRSLARLAAEA
ncbi:MAG TPA: histidine phosphatase family protein [Dongiaceae bacterium]|nr:histidine phosphatase family protein [Dongiaceae bacterium]